MEILIEKTKNVETAIYEIKDRSISSFWGIKDVNLTSYSILEGTCKICHFCFSGFMYDESKLYKKLRVQTLVIPFSVKDIVVADIPLSICDIINHSPFFEVENKTLFTKGKKELLRCFDFFNKEDYIVPNEVVRIWGDAFHACRFKRIVIGSSVKEMGVNPFMNMVRSSIPIILESLSDFFSYDDYGGGLYSYNNELVAYLGEEFDPQISEGTKSIRNYAFFGSRARNIWLPRSIKGFDLRKYSPMVDLQFIIPRELKYDYSMLDSHIIDEMSYRYERNRNM
jgi:hypothetical protein